MRASILRLFTICFPQLAILHHSALKGNPKSWNPETGIRNPEPGTRNPEPGTRNPEPESRTGIRNRNPESAIWNPESKNKAKQSSSNTQKSSCTFLACKSKKVNKKWLKKISNSIIHIQYIQILKFNNL